MTEFLRVGKGVYYGTPSDFNLLRLSIGVGAGYKPVRLPVITEDGDEVAVRVPDIPDDMLVLENIYGDWETPPDDPILYLLAHSDEAGIIKAEHVTPLADRLEAIKDAAVTFATNEYSATTAHRTAYDIDGMVEALREHAANGTDVRFTLDISYDPE